MDPKVISQDGRRLGFWGAPSARRVSFRECVVHSGGPNYLSVRRMWRKARKVVVRPEQPGDDVAIDAVHAASFPTDAEARLVRMLRAAGH